MAKNAKLRSIKNSVINELIALINNELKILRKKQHFDIDKYIGDVELQHIVERAFTNSIQSCIDIGARLIAEYNFDKADDYHGIFDILYQNKVIPAELCKKMHEMAGFRNALTHEYRLIKHERVYEHLQHSLNIFTKFIKSIIVYL